LRTKSRGKKKNQEDSFEINSTGKVEIKKNFSVIIEKDIDLFFNFDLIIRMTISKK